MTRKTYRTAQGKTVDLGALMLQNENIRAVGNMKVNARGDLVDGWNRPIDSRTQQVQKQYNKQISNVEDGPVRTSDSTNLAVKTKTTKKEKPTEVTPVQAESETATPESSGGLAAAIARARQIRQEPIRGANQIAKDQPGVTRI